MTPFKIHDVHGLDADAAAAELMANGLVAIDDISWKLVDCAWDEVLDALGHAADEMDLKRQRVETGWGPVLVIRDTEVVSAALARRLVLALRPAATKEPPRSTLS